MRRREASLGRRPSITSTALIGQSVSCLTGHQVVPTNGQSHHTASFDTNTIAITCQVFQIPEEDGKTGKEEESVDWCCSLAFDYLASVWWCPNLGIYDRIWLCLSHSMSSRLSMLSIMQHKEIPGRIMEVVFLGISLSLSLILAWNNGKG
eukprot:scaffold994_cov165-Ochromonas_danica.AAC.2